MPHIGDIIRTGGCLFLLFDSLCQLSFVLIGQRLISQLLAVFLALGGKNVIPLGSGTVCSEGIPILAVQLGHFVPFTALTLDKVFQGNNISSYFCPCIGGRFPVCLLGFVHLFYFVCRVL